MSNDLDPLTMLGIGGAAYALYRAKQADDATPKGDALHDASGRRTFTTNLSNLHNDAGEGLVLTTGKDLSGGGFQVGGPVTLHTEPTPLTVQGVLGTAVGVLSTGLAITAAIGGGSVSAGASIIAGGIASGGALAVAVGAIIGFIVIASLGIVREVNNLSKGRDGYMQDLQTLKSAAYNAARGVLTGAPPAVLDDIARCFAYVCVRGYNRASVAYILRMRSIFNPVSNQQQVGYWADRAMCVPEQWYIQAMPAWQHAAYLNLGMDFPDYSIESSLFPGSSYEATKARLGVMFDNKAEESADFVGRACRCTQMMKSNMMGGESDLLAVNINLEGPIAFARYYTVDGCIGFKDGTPNQCGPTNDPPAPHPNFSVALNAQLHTVKDYDGNSQLVWCYQESADAGTAIIR